MNDNANKGAATILLIVILAFLIHVLVLGTIIYTVLVILGWAFGFTATLKQAVGILLVINLILALTSGGRKK